MICKRCGAVCADYAQFCKNCGNRLEMQNTAMQNYQQPQYNQSYYQPQYHPVYGKPPEMPQKSLGIAGMVLGIVAAVLCLFGIQFITVVIPLGIVGLVLSVVAMNKAKVVGLRNKMALAGMICSIVALGISAFMFFVVMIVFALIAV